VSLKVNVPGCLGYRSGYYSRGLVTRVGKIELRIPQDRQGQFSTQIFERYQRSEKALVSALAEMYIQGVSTRKVKAITEEFVRPYLFGLRHQCGQ
jgi:putative transposase